MHRIRSAKYKVVVLNLLVSSLAATTLVPTLTALPASGAPVRRATRPLTYRARHGQFRVAGPCLLVEGNYAVYDTIDHIVFGQLAIGQPASAIDKSAYCNPGLVYRYFGIEDWMVGGHGFFDFNLNRRCSQGCFGAEAKGTLGQSQGRFGQLQGRLQVDGYFKLPIPSALVSEFTTTLSGTHPLEKLANQSLSHTNYWELQFEAQHSAFPWAKGFLRGVCALQSTEGGKEADTKVLWAVSNWSSEKALEKALNSIADASKSKKVDLTLGAIVMPVPCMQFRFGWQVGSCAFPLKLGFVYRFNMPWHAQLMLPSKVASTASLSGSRLDLLERSNTLLYTVVQTPKQSEAVNAEAGNAEAGNAEAGNAEAGNAEAGNAEVSQGTGTDKEPQSPPPGWRVFRKVGDLFWRDTPGNSDTDDVVDESGDEGVSQGARSGSKSSRMKDELDTVTWT